MRGPTVSVRRCRRSARDELGLRSVRLTVPSLARPDPHDPGTNFWRFAPNGLAELLHRLGMPASVADPHVPLVACAHTEKAR